MATPDEELEAAAAAEGGEEALTDEDAAAYAEDEAPAAGDAFRHPIQDDDYEASGLEDDSSDSGFFDGGFSEG